MGLVKLVFGYLLQNQLSQRDVQPITEMYKSIQDGFIRWMRIAEASLRDEFRGGG